MTRTLLYLLPTLLSFACGNDHEASVCTLVAEPAVVVTLTDAVTKAPIPGATVTITEGSYTETLLGLAGVYRGGFERPGTYDLTVAASGYQGVQRTGIVARALPCGPETQQLAIALQPTGVPVVVVVERDGEARVSIGSLRR